MLVVNFQVSNVSTNNMAFDGDGSSTNVTDSIAESFTFAVYPVIDLNICDPPYDFDAKGDSTLTTHLHFTTKEIGFSTLNVYPGAHFISKFFCFTGHT